MKKILNPIMHLSYRESSKLAKIMNWEIKSSIWKKWFKSILEKWRELRKWIINM